MNAESNTAAPPAIESPKVQSRNPLARWFFGGPDLVSRLEEKTTHQEPWYKVMWLTGVDYFSTLAYQAGIALIAASMLAPVATAVLVVVTLCCAVPVYREVARRSYAGLGSIAMLENLLSGWWSKLFVLILLGFAGTDFVITMTLSAADSARHAAENPLFKPYIGHLHMAITITLLALLAIVFLRGFKEAINLAVAVAVPYMVLNAILMARCLMEIARHPSLLENWEAALTSHGASWSKILIAACIVFPRLALGLSGFETGVAVMPLIKGDEQNSKTGAPIARIRNTGKLLLTAAALMSVFLLSSSFVSTLLVPEPAYREHGEASGRALAYLAHLYLGHGFGTVYDISTILILWFAGASAMAGLLNLIPRYLPRLGMAPQWVELVRPLVLVLFVIDLVVTLVFRASVDRQAGAYATGVLVLIFSASVAACLSLWHESRERKGFNSLLLRSFYCGLCAVVFAYTLAFNVKERPDGIIIASIFIFLLIVTSIASRYQRSTELRVLRCEFMDEDSRRIWTELQGECANLVGLSTLDPDYRAALRENIISHYKLKGPLTFVHVTMIDDRSEFYEQLRIKITLEGDDFLITVSHANVIANTVVYISLVLHACNVIMHLSETGNPLTRTVKYVLFGTGEVGLMVYEILVAYWKDQPECERPLLLLMAG